MAAVKQVGARIFVFHPPIGEGLELDPNTINFSYQMWAELQLGHRVMTPMSGTLAMSRAQLPPTVDALADLLLFMVRHPELPAEHRSAHWGGLVAELARVGVETDAETVMRLPFELEASREVVELLGAD